jgi:hypothetical protein
MDAYFVGQFLTPRTLERIQSGEFINTGVWRAPKAGEYYITESGEIASSSGIPLNYSYNTGKRPILIRPADEIKNVHREYFYKTDENRRPKVGEWFESMLDSQLAVREFEEKAIPQHPDFKRCILRPYFSSGLNRDIEIGEWYLPCGSAVAMQAKHPVIIISPQIPVRLDYEAALFTK